MHIAEGVAPLSVAAVGYVLAAGGVAIGLRGLRDEAIPRAALVCSVIFLASTLLRLPIGPSSVHPILNGLSGLLLGWMAIPIWVVALFLQALLFQFGGIATLGLNTVIMGAPAVVCHHLFGRRLSAAATQRAAFLLGAAAAVVSLLLSFVLWAIALVACGKQFGMFVALALPPHLVLTAMEAVFTGFIVAFLFRVSPAVLAGAGPAPEAGA
jgi:cobalt/nickel transport system permease protein